MAVGVKAMAWPPLVSPLDATSGRYSIVLLYLHRIIHSEYSYIFIIVLSLHFGGILRETLINSAENKQ